LPTKIWHYKVAVQVSSEHPDCSIIMPNSRSRSRSPSPRREDRRRSRSPRRRRDDDRPKRGGGGFKWKEKRRDEDGRGEEWERRLERGYRDRDRERPRSPIREKAPDDATIEKPKKDKKDKKEKKAGPSSVPTGEPMIIVNINDRLGTKAAIPCLASDPISKYPDSAFVRYLDVRSRLCRALQSTGGREDRSPTSRDSLETARRKAVQGPTDT